MSTVDIYDDLNMIFHEEKINDYGERLRRLKYE